VAAVTAIAGGATAAGLTGVAVDVSDKNSNDMTVAENYTPSEVARMGAEFVGAVATPNLPGVNSFVSAAANEVIKTGAGMIASNGAQQVAGGIQKTTGCNE
jgi:hypothetical protein